jgi:hypothetical protein
MKNRAGKDEPAAAFDDIGNRKYARSGGDSVGANLRQANYNLNSANQNQKIRVKIRVNPYLGSFSSLLSRENTVQNFEMPRDIRIQYPGAIYHVMSRGDRRKDRPGQETS